MGVVDRRRWQDSRKREAGATRGLPPVVDMAPEIHRREKRERELRDQQRHQELVSSQKPKARSKDIAQDENSERPNCRRIGT